MRDSLIEIPPPTSKSLRANGHWLQNKMPHKSCLTAFYHLLAILLPIFVLDTPAEAGYLLKAQKFPLRTGW